MEKKKKRFPEVWFISFITTLFMEALIVAMVAVSHYLHGDKFMEMLFWFLWVSVCFLVVVGVSVIAHLFQEYEDESVRKDEQIRGLVRDSDELFEVARVVAHNLFGAKVEDINKAWLRDQRHTLVDRMLIIALQDENEQGWASRCVQGNAGVFRDMVQQAYKEGRLDLSKPSHRRIYGWAIKDPLAKKSDDKREPAPAA